MLGLALGDSGAELEDAGGEVVFGGEGGGVEVKNCLVLALVEGVVDVDEFWGGVSMFCTLGDLMGAKVQAYRPLLRMDPWCSQLIEL